MDILNNQALSRMASLPGFEPGTTGSGGWYLKTLVPLNNIELGQIR